MTKARNEPGKKMGVPQHDLHRRPASGNTPTQGTNQAPTPAPTPGHPSIGVSTQATHGATQGHPPVGPSSTAAAALAPWFHNLHLPDGTQTAPEHPLGDFPACKWQALSPALPADLTGWSVLDIGCNAGFYSINLAIRGARVCAVDSNPHYLKQARWAADQFDLCDRIQFLQAQVYSLGRESKQFDLVLFLGLFYHLRYPQLALDIAARKTRRLLCFQSLSLNDDQIHSGLDDQPLHQRDAMLEPGWPKAAFVENKLASDPTVFWVPNLACMEAMLRDSGMRIVVKPGRETYICEPENVQQEQSDHGSRESLDSHSLPQAPEQWRTNLREDREEDREDTHSLTSDPGQDEYEAALGIRQNFPPTAPSGKGTEGASGT